MNICTKYIGVGFIIYCSLLGYTCFASPFDKKSIKKDSVLVSTESTTKLATVDVDENKNLNIFTQESCFFDTTDLNNPELYPCEGTVNCLYAQNVRSSYWGQIMTHYAPGTKVTIVAKEGDWYKIEYEGNGGFAYLHYSLVDTKYAPAYDGPNPYAYGDSYETAENIAKSKGYGKNTNSKIITKVENKTETETLFSSNSISREDNDNKDDDTETLYTNLSNADINGPEVPDVILEAIEKAKKTKWFTTKDKCLQYIGTVAYYAGANVSQANSIYPHIAYKEDKTYRGKKIPELETLCKQGKLLPGMLVHVKVAYDKDPAYYPETNAHHWFMYAGLKDGVPMWCDCLRGGRLQTTSEMNSNMISGRAKLPQYKPYGNIRRVTAIYDPFADQR